jgi:protein TonB
VTPPKTVDKPVPVPVKNTAPPDAFGRSNKKPAEVPIPQTHPVAPAPVTQQPSSPATGGVARANDIAPGTSGVTGIEGGDFPYSIYLDRMKSLIGTHWFRPQGATATATIHFTINRDGTIRDVMLETASGDGTFDRAAQRAVMESSPLPPLPFAFSGNTLGVHLTFR